MVKIGIIGTGMLGEAVGLHLLDSGYSVSVYNRTKSKTKNLEEKGADVAELPSVVAESSDLIITCVKDADAVKQVLFGQGGVVSGKHDDMTVADMSTINPSSAKEFSKKLHIEAAKDINKAKFKKLFVYGNYITETFNKIRTQKRGKILKSTSEILNIIKNDLNNGDFLMIKGSNSTGLNQITKQIGPKS